MKIGIASDHRGYKLKEKVKKYLNKKNIEFIDYGTDSSLSVDSFDYAMKLCSGINNNEVNCGFLICWTGNGMAIAANKVPGIICAKVDNAREAKLAREHNNANVLSFSSLLYTLDVKDIIDAYLKAQFLEEERLVRRLEKLKEYEKSIFKSTFTKKKSSIRKKISENEE